MKEDVLNTREYDISNYAEILEFILIAIGALIVPICMPQLLAWVFGKESIIANNSQYIVGTIVNTCLIIAGVNVKGWQKVIGLVTLPSLAAIASGLIFKTAAIYTVYMVPAIWIGNFAIVYFYRYLLVNKKINYIFTSGLSIGLKVALIFGGFNLLVWTNAIPEKPALVLSLAMGINQLITAILGSILAFGILKLAYKNNRKRA